MEENGHEVAQPSIAPEPEAVGVSEAAPIAREDMATVRSVRFHPDCGGDDQTEDTRDSTGSEGAGVGDEVSGDLARAQQVGRHRLSGVEAAAAPTPTPRTDGSRAGNQAASAQSGQPVRPPNTPMAYRARRSVPGNRVVYDMGRWDGPSEVVDEMEQIGRGRLRENRDAGITGMTSGDVNHARRLFHFMSTRSKEEGYEGPEFDASFASVAHSLAYHGKDLVLKLIDAMNATTGAAPSSQLTALDACMRLCRLVKMNIPLVEGADTLMLRITSQCEENIKRLRKELRQAKAGVRRSRTKEVYIEAGQWATMKRFEDMSNHAFEFAQVISLRVAAGDDVGVNTLVRATNAIALALAVTCHTSRKGPLDGASMVDMNDVFSRPDGQRFYSSARSKTYGNSGNAETDFNGPRAYELFAMYRDHIRPAVLRKVEGRRNRTMRHARDGADVTGHFFITRDGCGFDFGRGFQSFAEYATKGEGPRGEGLRLNLTAFRRVIATYTQELLEAGHMTKEEASVIHRADNHSACVALTNYVKAGTRELQRKSSELMKKRLGLGLANAPGCANGGGGGASTPSAVGPVSSSPSEGSAMSGSAGVESRAGPAAPRAESGGVPLAADTTAAGEGPPRTASPAPGGEGLGPTEEATAPVAVGGVASGALVVGGLLPSELTASLIIEGSRARQGPPTQAVTSTRGSSGAAAAVLGTGPEGARSAPDPKDDDNDDDDVPLGDVVRRRLFEPSPRTSRPVSHGSRGESGPRGSTGSEDGRASGRVPGASHGVDDSRGARGARSSSEPPTGVTRERGKRLTARLKEPSFHSQVRLETTTRKYYKGFLRSVPVTPPGNNPRRNTFTNSESYFVRQAYLKEKRKLRGWKTNDHYVRLAQAASDALEGEPLYGVFGERHLEVKNLVDHAHFAARFYDWDGVHTAEGRAHSSKVRAQKRARAREAGAEAARTAEAKRARAKEAAAAEEKREAAEMEATAGEPWRADPDDAAQGQRMSELHARRLAAYNSRGKAPRQRPGR